MVPSASIVALPIGSCGAGPGSGAIWAVDGTALESLTQCKSGGAARHAGAQPSRTVSNAQ